MTSQTTKKQNIPFSLNGKEVGKPSWLKAFSWPVSPSTTIAIAPRVYERYMNFAISQSGRCRDLILMAKCANEATTLIETAFVCSAAGTHHLEMVGNDTIQTINTGYYKADTAKNDLQQMGLRHIQQKINFKFLRQLARVRSWSSPGKAICTLLKPDALAITHNALLRDTAKKSHIRLAFQHAMPFFERALQEGRRRPDRFMSDLDLRNLAQEYSFVLAADPILLEHQRINVASLLEPVALQQLESAHEILSCLTSVRHLPGELWTGNGDFLPSRALGLEIRRRGGAVKRFDHGGTLSLVDSPHYQAHQDFAVATEAVVPTPIAARLPNVQKAKAIAAAFYPVKITGAEGDPSLRPDVQQTKTNKQPHRVPRVLYAATAYYGFFQSYPAFTNGPVYLDWQYRLMDSFKDIDAEFIHKPHPGGLYNGTPPGLAAYAPSNVKTVQTPFEAVLSDADLFLFDFAGSTTFSIALCTDKPIILLDLGNLTFGEKVDLEIRKRCHVISVGIDERNRPVIDTNDLKEAIISLTGCSFDPTYFRNLFLND
ncbi:hypothetical protein [Aestuariispira ectoiniformans]|uniref:hypothetical protein n=1 Tax=Aestuariispira ectoiniformans TaxID=2775080 RepID=UPI00223AD920|nr:hypothetical protein [Aestuariispira ectoiniformans]